MIQNDTEKTSKNIKKNIPKFYCEICDFRCFKKGDWTRHIERKKHIDNIMVQNDTEKTSKNIQSEHLFICPCGNSYRYRTGLSRHKKICNFSANTINKNYYSSDSDSDDEGNKNQNNIIDKDLIMMLIKDHSETKAMMLKIIENGTTSHSHNNTNSHNKAFNLQFFLNETCKNAMNITDFVESITPQLEDLEDVCESGYIKGISNIIVKNLKALDVTERPVHCVDKKREVLYVKDEDKWEKEDEDKKKLRKAIKKVVNKNYKLLPKYREKYPGCQFSESKHADHYNKLVIEVMGGEGDNDEEKENKIIRNISKVITIDKSIHDEPI
jgi:hypothetical protein